MKAQDIEIGATYGVYLFRNRSRHVAHRHVCLDPLVEEAEVVAIGGGKATVVCRDADFPAGTYTRIIPLANVVDRWSTVVSIRAAAAAEKAAFIASERASVRRLREVLGGEIIRAHALAFTVERDGSHESVIRGLSRTDLAEIVEAAYEAGMLAANGTA